MVDISKEIDKAMLKESFSAKKPHIFNNGKTTFKQLKDVFTDIFSTRTLKFSKKVPKVDAYLTVKDGNWLVSSYLRPEQQYPIGNAMKMRRLSEDESNGNIVADAVKALASALEDIDPMLLNRFFANGNNRLHVSLVCPPTGCSDAYNQKCFAEYNGIDCFDGKKKVGEDKDSSFELYKQIKEIPSLKSQFAEITPGQLACIKCCNDEKMVLEQLLKQLAKLVDGLGWGCTISDYVQDRYSRYLVNKALEHGIDVSKKGALVNELAARLSGADGICPTKSDLATFAKREGIDIKSDNYKAFLDDVEQNAEQTNKDIVLPIENALYFAVSSIANSLLSYIALDPSEKAKKLAKQIASELFAACKSIEDCVLDSSKLDKMKKALSQMCAYAEEAPDEVRFVDHGTPYLAKCDCGKLGAICKMIA